MGHYWFLISIIDWSVGYRPETKTLLDIDTALNFFLVAREATKLRIGNMARSLVAAWNKKYSGTTSVSKKSHFLKKPYLIRFFYIKKIFFSLRQTTTVPASPIIKPSRR